MISIQPVKDFLFKIRYAFKGVPFKVEEDTIFLDESLRRWDVAAEATMQEVLREKLKTGDVFIDVGANFGLHAIYAAKLVGTSGCVFAFEPVESNLKLLYKNIFLNKLTERIKVVPQALSNSEEATLNFYLPSDEVAVTASLSPDKDTCKTIQVFNTRLDEYWQDVNLPIRLIKIDVEGAELEVLKGAVGLLQQWKPTLLIEVHAFAFPKFGTSLKEFREFLERRGYQENLLSSEYFRGEEYFQALYTYQA